MSFTTQTVSIPELLPLNTRVFVFVDNKVRSGVIVRQESKVNQWLDSQNVAGSNVEVSTNYWVNVEGCYMDPKSLMSKCFTKNQLFDSREALLATL
jgi:hypothetical protein